MLEPAFRLLGFSFKRDPRDSEGSPNPHYHLINPESKNSESLAVCLTYPWGRFLDGKDEARDFRPLPRIYGRKLREFYKEFSENEDIAGLVAKVKKVKMESGKDEKVPAQKRPQALRKEDLHLICSDYVFA